MSRRLTILLLLRALLAAAIIGQCAASLALAVRADWHEAAHQHHAHGHEEHPGEDHPHEEPAPHDGAPGDHTCPAEQLALGLWAAPAIPVLALPRPPAPPAALTFPDTARQAPAMILSASVLEHAPPARG